MKAVLLQIMITALALSVTLGSPVNPEPRKFVYQVGYPSVKRYPVFPDRHFELDQSQVLKLAAEKNRDLKNELVPDVLSTKKPGMTQPEPENLEAANVDFMAKNETSTDSLNLFDGDLTTTTSRIFTTSSPAPETTSTSSFSLDGDSAPVEGGFNPSTFFFTPHPSSIIGNEEESSSTHSSSIFGSEDPSSRPSNFENTDPSSRPSVFGSGSPSSSSSIFESELPSSEPERRIFESSNNQDEHQDISSGPFRLFGDNVDGHNSVFPLEPVTNEEGDLSAREDETHFAVFTEGREESTDMTMTTDLPVNALLEEEEKMADSTLSPIEEEFAELAENRTGSPLLEEAATESAWDEVTQEIFTTEEADVFL